MSNQKDPFASIDTNDLANVSGGAARVASSGASTSSNDQLMTMLTSIGDSLKDLNSSGGGGDQMQQMMMMMMMMGGFGGGGGGGYVAAQQQPPTFVEVESSGGGIFGGSRKGW